MHYILCSDNRITYTLIIYDYSCNIHEYRVEDCGVRVNHTGVGTFRLGSELDKPAKMTGVENGVFNVEVGLIRISMGRMNKHIVVLICRSVTVMPSTGDVEDLDARVSSSYLT